MCQVGTHAFTRSACVLVLALHVFVVNTANSVCERVLEIVFERVYEGASRSVIPLYFLDNRIHGRRENAEAPVGRACGVVSLHPKEPLFAELSTVTVLD